MNGLERMTAPRRWPLWTGMGIGIIVVASLLWQRAHLKTVLPPDPSLGVEASPGDTIPAGAVPVTSSIPLPPPPVVAAVTGGTVSVEVVAAVPGGTGSVEAVSVTTGAAAPVVEAASLYRDAEALLAEGKKDKAREAYLAALAAKPDEVLRASLETRLGALNVELIRLPWPMAEKQEVIVQEGDSIKAMARKFGTTVELIVKGNELKRPDIIRPGQHLKVFAGKMAIVVDKARKDLVVTANDRFFKRYRVGTGRYDKTPAGLFVITERIPEPPWWRDDGRIVPFGDKENILGTRWMAIKATGTTKEIKGYGIHGTWDTNSVGKAESAGCIRLKNEDVEELFELVPIGTSVTIVE